MIKKPAYFCLLIICMAFLWNCPSPIDPGTQLPVQPTAEPTAVPTAGPTGTPGPYKPLWHTRFGGEGNDRGYGIIANNTSITTGHVVGDVDFDHDGLYESDKGEVDFGTLGDWDAFITVRNLATGDLIWSKRMGGSSGNDIGYGVAANSSYIAVTGNISGDADLDGDGFTTGEGEATATYGNGRIFVALFNASDGSTVWTKRLGGSIPETGKSVALDSNNNVILTGWLTGQADLDGDNSITALTDESADFGETDIFISAFSAGGTNVWYERLGGIGGDIGKSLAVNGNMIAVTGNVTNEADLDGNGTAEAGTPETAGYLGSDVFVSVFNATTYEPVWIFRLGGAGIDSGNSITINGNGDIVIAGEVTGDADFNGDLIFDDQGSSDNGYGQSDAFVAVYEPFAGVYKWSKRLGGTSGDSGNSIATDSLQHVIVAGWVDGNADLNGNGMIGETGINGEYKTGGLADAFFSVFDSSGVHYWSMRLGGALSDHANSVTADTSGNILVTGLVSGSADLDGDGSIFGVFEYVDSPPDIDTDIDCFISVFELQ